MNNLLLHYLLTVIITAGSVQAQALNVTDLLSYPPCAQNCIPLGFGPPADCGSLANLTCVCKEAAFSQQIASCEISTCSADERARIRDLTLELCAPVGGYAADTIVPAISSYLATAPPYPTATPLGDPANILAYPECAQICSNETSARANTPCDPTKSDCLCGAEFRSRTAGCEKITCSGEDYNRTQALGEELCAPLYASSSLLGPSVTSAIASRTSVAVAAVASRDAINPQTWPPCAQACIAQNLPQSGCGTLSNRRCACQTSDLSETSGACFLSSCGAADYLVVQGLALELCNPIGGTGNGSNASIAASAPTPSTPVFTGVSPKLETKLVSWVGMGISLYTAFVGIVVIM